jgi:predicted sugar kinase
VVIDLLQIRTGGRLHLGLMELAQGHALTFGGLGVMLREPSLLLEMQCIHSEHDVIETGDVQPEDQAELTWRIFSVLQLRKTLYGQGPICRIRLCQMLPLHAGLGSGTQLACAVAVGLELLQRGIVEPTIEQTIDQNEQAFSENWRQVSSVVPRLSLPWLARHSGRGLRSAVGLHGFLQGGFIFDKGQGQTPARPALSRSQQAIPMRAKDVTIADELPARAIETESGQLPAEWRVLLVRPPQKATMYGHVEADLLDALGSVPNPHSSRMEDLARLAMQSLTPIADFDKFTGLLDEYMRLAAEPFLAIQGGLYNGPAVASAVKLARDIGLQGVGQSSWGPTVFGFAASPSEAMRLACQLQEMQPDWYVQVANSDSAGAEWRWSNCPQVED